MSDKSQGDGNMKEDILWWQIRCIYSQKRTSEKNPPWSLYEKGFAKENGLV